MQYVKLNEIADILNGYAFKSKNYVKEGIRVIRIANVQDGYIVDDEPCFYPYSFENEIEKYRLYENDMLVSLTGNVGRVGCISKELLPAALNQRVCCVRLKSELVYPKYLYYYLLRKQFSKDCVDASKGVAQLNLSTKWLENYEVPLITFEEQERIVARIEDMLSQLDEAVETLNKTKQQLELYHHSLIDFEIQSNKYMPIGECILNMGQGWSPKCINKNSVLDEEWAVIKTTAIQPMQFNYYENKILPNALLPREQHIIEEGDILITRAGPRARCGVCCLVKETKKKLLNCDKAYCIKVDRRVILPEYFEYVLNSPKFLKEIDMCKTGGNESGLNLTQKRFLNIKIPVPSIDVQKLIVERIEEKMINSNDILKSIIASLLQSEAMRQSILKQAFEGKL